MAPDMHENSSHASASSAREARTAVVKRPVRKRTQAEGFENLNSVCKGIAVAALVIVIGIGMFSRFYVARFGYLRSTAAMEQGNIAEQLRNGKGFTTTIGHPLGLDKTAGANRWDDLSYNPLYPLSLSIFFRIRGGGDSSIALFNGLVQFAAGLLVYLIGANLRGPRTGILAVLLYCCSIEAISTALQGTGLTLTAFLVTLGVWLAIKTRRRLETPGGMGMLWAALTGLALGLAYLSGGMAVLLIIPVAVLVAAGQRNRWPVAGVVLAAFIITLVPWTARNLAKTGTLSPRLTQYKLLTRTQTYPGGTILQKLPGEAPTPLAFVLSHPGEMGLKFVAGAAALYRDIPAFVNSYLFPFVLLFGFLAGGGSIGRRLWGAVLGMLLLQAATACLYGFDAETLQILMPAGTSLAAAAIAALASTHIGQFKWRVALAGLVLIVVAIPYAASLSMGGKTEPLTSVRNLAPLKLFVSPEALVCTDVPVVLTWYTGIPSVMLPDKILGVNDLAAKGADPDYIYLSADLLLGPPTAWNRRDISDEEKLVLGRPFGLSSKDIPPVFERRIKRASGVRVEKVPTK